MKAIILELAESMGTTVSAIKGKSTKRELSMRRQITAYCLKKITGKPLKEIGDELGGRDHTTMTHSIQTVIDLRSTNDPAFTSCADLLPHRYKSILYNETCAFVINNTLRMAKIKFPSIKYRP